jgi:hypothetical protein
MHLPLTRSLANLHNQVINRRPNQLVFRTNPGDPVFAVTILSTNSSNYVRGMYGTLACASDSCKVA